MLAKTLLAQPVGGLGLVKRIRKKSMGSTPFERRLEADGISMFELTRVSGYSYQHVWNAAKGRTAGSPEFWVDIDKAVDEIKAARKDGKTTKKKPKS